MLTLLFLIDEEYIRDCKPSGGAITAIIAGIFYLGVGINILFCPVPKTAVIPGNRKCFQNASVQAFEEKDNKPHEVRAVSASDTNAEDSNAGKVLL